MKEAFSSLESAVEALKQGQLIILTDSEHRENEGDLVMSAEHVTPEAINFMLKAARGLICVPILKEHIDRMGIPMMPQRTDSPFGCAFTVSVDAAKGVSTGSSAYDRAHTIQLLADPKSTVQDFHRPGHVFPLSCHSRGLLGRQGHTEGSIALMDMAGLRPVSVICEILNESGRMADLSDLVQLSKTHQLPMVNMQRVIEGHPS